VALAPDVPGLVGSRAGWAPKPAGRLRVVFLSRIARIKNLRFALDALRHATGTFDLDIYGPVVDSAYWEQCRQVMASLPDTVQVRYHGAVPHDQVSGIMNAHDLLLLPTLGESYCHVVVEALAAGCPVLTSDQTRWGDLQAEGAGWTLRLGRPQAFTEVLSACAAMAPREYEVLREAARQYGVTALDATRAVEAHRRVLLGAARRPRGTASRS